MPGPTELNSLPPSVVVEILDDETQPGIVVEALCTSDPDADATRELESWASGSGGGRVLQEGPRRVIWFAAGNPGASERDPVRWMVRALALLRSLGAFGSSRAVTAARLLDECRLPDGAPPSPGLYRNERSLRNSWLRALKAARAGRLFGFTGSALEPKNAFFLRLDPEQLVWTAGTPLPEPSALADRMAEVRRKLDDSPPPAQDGSSASELPTAPDRGSPQPSPPLPGVLGDRSLPAPGRVVVGLVLVAALPGLVALWRSSLSETVEPTSPGQAVAATLESGEADRVVLRFMDRAGTSVRADSLEGGVAGGVVTLDGDAGGLSWVLVGTGTSRQGGGHLRLYEVGDEAPSVRYEASFFAASPEGGWAAQPARFGFRGYALLGGGGDERRGKAPAAVAVAADDTFAPSYLLRVGGDGAILGQRFHPGTLDHFVALRENLYAVGGWANRLCFEETAPCQPPPVVWLTSPPADGERSEFPPGCGGQVVPPVVGWTIKPARFELRALTPVDGDPEAVEVYALDRARTDCWSRWVVGADGTSELRGHSETCDDRPDLVPVEGPFERFCEQWRKVSAAD